MGKATNRAVCLALSALMLLSISACGGDTKDSPKDTNKSDIVTTKNPESTISPTGLDAASISTFNTDAIVNSNIFNTTDLDKILSAVTKSTLEGDSYLVRGNVQQVKTSTDRIDCTTYDATSFDILGYTTAKYPEYTDATLYIGVSTEEADGYPKEIQLLVWNTVNTLDNFYSILNESIAPILKDSDGTIASINIGDTEVALFDGIKYGVDTWPGPLMSQAIRFTRSGYMGELQPADIKLDIVPKYQAACEANGKVAPITDTLTTFSDCLAIHDYGIPTMDNSTATNGSMYKYISSEIKVFNSTDEGTDTTENTITASARYADTYDDSNRAGYKGEDTVIFELNWVDSDVNWKHSSRLDIIHIGKQIRQEESVFNTLMNNISTNIASYCGIDSTTNTWRLQGRSFGDSGELEVESQAEAYTKFTNESNHSNDKLACHIKSEEATDDYGFAQVKFSFDELTDNLVVGITSSYFNYFK